MKTIISVLFAFLSITLASCGGGGGGGGETTTETLTGTAAQGTAIANGTVTIKDRNGSTSTATTTADGKYTINVAGKTAPFLLRISVGTGYLYSVATATGTVNIHPFTDLIIRNWYKVQGSDVETDFNGTSALVKVPTATEINTIESVIRDLLAINLTEMGLTTNFNLLTSSFDANHIGFDKVLDQTAVDISMTGAVTVTATDPTTGISGTMVTMDLATNMTAADTTKPSDPTGLAPLSASMTSIVLVWNASTDNMGIAGYNIYRSGSKIGTSPYPVYSDTGLTFNSYCYQVESFDGAGNLSANKSSEVCATPAADTVAPSTPTNLTATAVSATGIDLSWTASTDDVGVAGYALYRGATKIATVTGTSYSDIGLSSATLYSYTVKAMDAALNYSAASNSASATTQVGIAAAPTGVTAAAANGEVTISWDTTSGATSYNLYWLTTTGVTKTNGNKITGAISPYTHTGRTNDTTYYYVVTAVNSLGESVESVQVSATPIVATTQVGTPFSIANTLGREMSVSTAFDGTNFLVGIQGDAASAQSITAQFVAKTGALVGSRIALGTTGGAPVVAFDGTNYLLAWAEDTTLSSFIAGQFIDTAGTPVGQRFTITTIDSGFELRELRIIFDGTNYFVVWDRWTTASPSTSDLFGQFITPDGTLLGSVVAISTAAGKQREFSLAFDGTNILAVWVDGRSGGVCGEVIDPDVGPNPVTACFETDLYGQFIAKSGAATAGTLAGENFLITAGTLPRDNPTGIAYDGTNYLVTFIEETTLPAACSATECDWEAYGILVTKSGTTSGSRFILGNPTTSHKFLPAPTYLGSQYLVTWTDNFGTPAATTVKGIYVTTAGALSGSEFNLFTPAASGALPWLGLVFSGGGVNLVITNWGIPNLTNPYDVDAYTSAEVTGALITIP